MAITDGNPANPTYVYVAAFVDELQRAGLHHVVICPGSRSTPLALVLAEQPAIRVWMHVDERSAAFFALGMAKRLQQPVALLCTSGTAAANFFPAIAEAHLTHIPLLVLTADRPHELRDCGAPQAIDQNRLYGTHVKWFAEVALPEASNPALRYIRTLANRSVALTTAVPAGPVHLNFPFREPLTPNPQADQPLLASSLRDPLAWGGRSENAPYIAVSDAPLGSVSAETIARLADQMQSSQRGLIVVGPIVQPELTQPLLQLAARLGYPLLADPLSQLRSGTPEQSPIIASYDAFLRLDSFTDTHEPELVLRFGAMPVAKPLLLYLKKYAHCPQIVVDGQSGWEEPTQLAEEMLHTDPASFCRELLQTLGDQPVVNRWLQSWLKIEQVTRQTLHRVIEDFTPLFEGRVFRELASLLPEGATLFAGNSMPVRDLDTFFWNVAHPVRVLGNRGANGIDGVVSSALGVSSAQKEPTVLVIGDLSFFHDLNGLLAARLHQLHLIIVLINNDGGGIFSFLPQAEHPEHFEQLFGTPTGLDFAPVVQMYGGRFQRITDWSSFRHSFRTALQEQGLQVLELQTDRASNVSLHRQLWRALESELQQES
ncbi:2-succinyl-5-enolpyruvyl-6-hydroxy-3-cyclohexene- 1-carboxylate synthase [Tengunoibacter tsumagoiensis]|uniref:2-succinyl-5-enolpyruvyl-6-hydroxy-3-cyclohexene-1-carboxylate synthase n=2 Tax=Tengunoibacter tsumagoiensis TaxID=2014871 RepID=A0A401ZXE3_9CHLR|nr:2-succinyl-5-enolpyruvyl-6-hydroxy-3-cyclohexene- 1-carboxylate synthase [Tengunoibacter tsumagoiensis]